MSKTFEFDGIKLECKQIDILTCNGCYFESQSVSCCNEQQESGLVPDCTTDDLCIFIKIVEES